MLSIRVNTVNYDQYGIIVLYDTSTQAADLKPTDFEIGIDGLDVTFTEKEGRKRKFLADITALAGISGATLYDKFVNLRTFFLSNGETVLLSSLLTSLGLRDDTVATSDEGTFSVISLTKRELQTLTSILTEAQKESATGYDLSNSLEEILTVLRSIDKTLKKIYQ